MALILTRDNIRLGNIVQSETGTEIGYCRKSVVVREAAATTYKLGEVLGKVTATGKYVRLAPAASDGSQTFAGIFIGSDEPFDPDNLVVPAATDKTAVVLYRGRAGLFKQMLRWPVGITQPQKDAAYVQMDAAGFKLI